MDIYKMVKNYLFLRKNLFLGFLIMSITTWTITIALPYLSGKYMDNLLKIKSLDIVYTFTIIMVAVLIFDVVLGFLKSLLVTKLSCLTAFDLNYKILEHVKKLPVNYFNGKNTAYLTQRINSDANVVTGFVIENMIALATNILTFLIAAVYMLTVNKVLACFLFLIIPIYVAVYKLFKNILYKRGYENREKLNEFFGKMNEQLHKIKLIKLNSWYDVFASKFKDDFNPAYKSQIEMTKVQGFYSSAITIVTYSAKIIVFFAGGIQVIQDKMTIGQFTAINAYFSMLLDCTTYFVSFGQSYQQAKVAYTRITELFQAEIECNGKKILTDIESIEFKNITFGYDPKRDLLEGFDQTFEKGRIYSIIGRNGIGKSTLIDLMVGLHNDYDGEILINRTCIKDIDVYNLRRNLVGFVEQEPILFNDTVFNNLTFGVQGYTKSKLDSIMTDMGITDLMEKLPVGINTEVSEKANNISGGEKQKISIIRSLVKNAQLLVFDEPTSAMDATGIRNFKRLLEKLKHDRIIVIITHSHDLIDISDEIIEISKEKEISATA